MQGPVAVIVIVILVVDVVDVVGGDVVGVWLRRARELG